MPNLVKIRPAIASRQSGDLYHSVTFLCAFFPSHAQAQIERPILAGGGLNNASWCEEVPFLLYGQIKFKSDNLYSGVPTVRYQKWGIVAPQ